MEWDDVEIEDVTKVDENTIRVRTAETYKAVYKMIHIEMFKIDVIKWIDEEIIDHIALKGRFIGKVLHRE